MPNFMRYAKIYKILKNKGLYYFNGASLEKISLIRQGRYGFCQ
tara:strand:+ start:541 stop:669 length:129 start_codon:yes stop_codon:yes gene_type:complete